MHTDKPYYVAGDTLWFRAHLVDAVTHTPISRSRYINMELLDNATDTLVQRAIIRCDSDGVFANALILPRNLHRGTYTLAAYTQWMRNFSAEHFFYKQISVVDSGDEVWLVPSAISQESGMPADSLLQVNCRKDYMLIQPRAPQRDEQSTTLLCGLWQREYHYNRTNPGKTFTHRDSQLENG